MCKIGFRSWCKRYIKESKLEKQGKAACCRDSNHQAQPDVFKPIWLQQWPHAIIYSWALKEGGQHYCGITSSGSAIENHVETLEILCVKCKGAFWQMQFPSHEKSWFKLLKSKSSWNARVLQAPQHSVPCSLLPSPLAGSFSSPSCTEAGHKTESIWVQSQKSPAIFCSAGNRSAAGWGEHRGLSRERTAVLPCPWPWETPPCFQANINNSCSFPEEVFTHTPLTPSI